MSAFSRSVFTPISRGLPRRVLRPYHATLIPQLPYKDSQDRESLQPRSTEYTKSGAGDESVAHDDVAFDPTKTSPERQAKSQSQSSDSGADPLQASGANQPLSKPTGDEKQSSPGAGQETRKGGASGRGSAPKAGSPGRT